MTITPLDITFLLIVVHVIGLFILATVYDETDFRFPYTRYNRTAQWMIVLLWPIIIPSVCFLWLIEKAYRLIERASGL